VASLLTRSNPEEARLAFKRALVALPLAVAFQAGLLGLIVLLSSARPPRPARASARPVSLRAISAAGWAANRGQVAERPAPLHPRGQVVDVADGNQQVPEASKYLAETNHRTETETRAREQTAVYSRATRKTHVNPTAAPSARGQLAPQVSTEAAPNFLTSALGRRRWSLLGERSSPGVAEVAPSEEQRPLGTEAGTERVGGATSEGGGAPNDALTEVPQGDGTVLNTREWRYAAFFNRVKQAVASKWDPNGRLRLKNRNVGFNDRVTMLHVALRPDGSLADVYVAKSCGIDELDQEAVKAFEQAQPFSNPPAALVDDGAIRFAFGFTLTNEGLGDGALRFRPLGR
jgi:TonB family protein